MISSFQKVLDFISFPSAVGAVGGLSFSGGEPPFKFDFSLETARVGEGFTAKPVLVGFGSLPKRYGHKSHVVATHSRTSLGCCTQQSRHLALIDFRIWFLVVMSAHHGEGCRAKSSRQTTLLRFSAQSF